MGNSLVQAAKAKARGYRSLRNHLLDCRQNRHPATHLKNSGVPKGMLSIRPLAMGLANQGGMPSRCFLMGARCLLDRFESRPDRPAVPAIEKPGAPVPVRLALELREGEGGPEGGGGWR